jgi:WD40 repeat protein
LAGHADRITDCIVEETNHRLLTASWDKSVALWDMSGSATKKIVCFTITPLLQFIAKHRCIFKVV